MCIYWKSCVNVDFVKWKCSQVYNLLDSLTCMEMYFLEEKRCCHYSMRRGSSGSCWGSKQSFTRVCCTSSSKTLPSAPRSPCHTHICTHTCAQVVFLRLHLLATFVKIKAWHLIYRQRCFLIAWRRLSCSSSFVPFFGPSRHCIISLYYLAFLHCAHITISLSTRPILFIFTAVTPAISHIFPSPFWIQNPHVLEAHMK